MFIKLPARRPRSNVSDSDSVPEVSVEVTEYGLPVDPTPAPAVALAIAVGLAMIPMEPFPPPPPSPPPPGVAALMVVDLPGLDPLVEAADDIGGIVIPEPIAEEQENEHYHHHQQHQHQQNSLLLVLPQRPHPAPFPSSSSAEGGRGAVDSSITNSAVQIAGATALHRRSSRRTKPPASLLLASTQSTLAMGTTTVTQHSLSNLRRTRSVNNTSSPPSLPLQRRRSLRLLGRQTTADTH